MKCNEEHVCTIIRVYGNGRKAYLAQCTGCDYEELIEINEEPDTGSSYGDEA